MQPIKNVEDKIKEMNLQVVKEFETEVKLSKKMDDNKQGKSNEYDQQLNKLLQSAGIDTKETDSRNKTLEKELDQHLGKIRPGLLNRTGSTSSSTDFLELYNEAANNKSYVKARPASASLMANDLQKVEGVGNLAGGLWVSPADPSQIKIKDYARGSGTGWGAVAGPPPPTANVYFNFTPDVTATWNLTAYIAFDGFYILKADDGYFTHKYAKVKLSASIKAYQYSSQGKRNYNIVDIDKSDVDVFNLIGTTEALNTTALFRKGDPVVVSVTITVYAQASGGGSYAELNFKDGTANHIIPALLVANPQ